MGIQWPPRPGPGKNFWKPKFFVAAKLIISKISKFNLLGTWIVRQFENEYNPTHWHGGHISGAGFLQVPKSLGANISLKNHNNFVYLQRIKNQYSVYILIW